jgi:hypothetical protein
LYFELWFERYAFRNFQTLAAIFRKQIKRETFLTEQIYPGSLIGGAREVDWTLTKQVEPDVRGLAVRS